MLVSEFGSGEAENELGMKKADDPGTLQCSTGESFFACE